MDKRPAIDRSLLIPIGISVFSLVGIFFIFLTVYLDKPQVAVPVNPTSTPFKYLFLATETLIPDPALETVPPEEAVPEESDDPVQEDPSNEDLSPFATEEPLEEDSFLDPDTTPETSTAALNVVDRYDNTDARLEYDGDWINEVNVTDAYQNTLSVSNTIGNDLILSFTGQQVTIGYVGKPGLGSLVIYIDDDEFQVDQSAGKEWVSPRLDNAEHFVVIMHESGASVNLDYINILNAE